MLKQAGTVCTTTNVINLFNNNNSNNKIETEELYYEVRLPEDYKL